MKFTMTSPCANCPFRTDIRPFLTNSRAEEISDSLIIHQQTFACHKTTVESDYCEGESVETEGSQHCAGALIMLEHMEQPNQMMRIAERLGMYDRSKLNMDAPVFEDSDIWVDANCEDVES